MFEKRNLLKKFDNQRKIKELRNNLAVYKQELEAAQEKIASLRKTNHRMRREMKRKTERNKILLKWFAKMKGVIESQMYPFFNDLQVAKEGIDKLEYLEEFNDKQDDKIAAAKHNKYVVT